MRREIVNSRGWQLTCRYAGRNTERESSEKVGITSTSLVKPRVRYPR